VAGRGEKMSTNKIMLNLTVEEVTRLTKIVIDEDKEDAFAFIKEIIKPKMDQFTRGQ
jgi:hypothetical protein